MLSSILAVELGISALVLLVWAYATYWAFVIRRSMFVPLYRRQALGTGAVGASLTMVFSIDFFLVFFYPYNPASDAVISLVNNLLAVGWFAWVDSTVLVARRSDPFLRDLLHWSRLRIPLWILVLGGAPLPFYFTLSSLVNGSFGSLTAIPPLIIDSLTVELFTVFISAIIALPISAARSRDRVLRKHLLWFGLMLIFFVPNVVLSFIVLGSGSGTGFIRVLQYFFLLQNPAFAAISYSTIFLSGYSLYRCARSLVPINRISLTDVKI